ncbi:30S ribosomal protein S4e [Candidatus Woesearchaeota archaeon]|nr:30S ribosomal protein S4e [Candidatus Woesearchaeota archaeon]
MVKNHLSRLNSPTSWGISRKGIKFTTRTSPGPHKLKESITLIVLIEEILKYGRNRKEVKKILNEGKILINGKIRKDIKFPVGLMDLISVPSLNENFRLFYNPKGKFVLTPVEEAEKDFRLIKIIRKNIIKKGKIQIGTSDGSSLLTEKNDYKLGDSLIVSIKDGKIKEHLSFNKGSRIFIEGGKKKGTIGTLQEFKENNIIVKSNDEEFETAKRYAFVIGKIKTPEAK